MTMEGPAQGWAFFKNIYQGSDHGIPEREQTELRSPVLLGGRRAQLLAL